MSCTLHFPSIIIVRLCSVLSVWAGLCSRCSDWLRAGRSGDRIPVGQDFLHLSRWAHPASCTMGTGSFPGVKSSRGMTLTPHLLLVPLSRKSRAVPLLPLWAIRPVQSLSACTVELYLFSPYGPYALYRASVPVQYSYTSTPPMGHTACTEPQCLYSTAIPLLPIWAIQAVQCLYKGALYLTFTCCLSSIKVGWPNSIFKCKTEC